MNISLANAMPAALQVKVLMFDRQSTKNFEADTEFCKYKTARTKYDIFSSSWKIKRSAFTAMKIIY